MLASTAGLGVAAALGGCDGPTVPEPSGPLDRVPGELRFDQDFRFGVATSAYQIEGAADRAGRGASIWDTFTRRPGVIEDASSGVEACDHYHLWESDLDLVRQLKLQSYRFSVSWSRFMPEGRGRINPRGIEFYQRLVAGLRKRGIRPVATLYHWDLPQVLQDKGGWENRDCAEWFADYAGALFDRLDGVEDWVTVNEAKIIAQLGYLRGLHAPGKSDPTAAGRVIHHLGLAHGRAVERFRAGKHRGRIGPCLQLSPCYPADDSPEAAEAAKVYDAWENTLYLDPILKGRYPALPDRLEPEVVKGLRAAVRPGDAATIGRPVDFVGVNYYSPTYVGADGKPQVKDKTSAAGWQQINPQGLYDVLRRVSTDYDVELVVTETGIPDSPGQTPPGDSDRIDYLRDHLGAVHRAIDDGSRVTAFHAWTLFDCFEWSAGYTQRWGLIQVKRSKQRRIIKNSARWYAGIASSRVVRS